MNKNGRNHKPLAQHKLEGTFRKERHENKLYLDAYKVAPKPPSNLGAEGNKEWQRIASVLVQNQILTPMDIKALEFYCMQFDIIYDCYEDIKQKGVTAKGYNDNIVKNPAWQTMKEAIELTNKIAAKFGLNPVDRMKITVKPQEEDELEKLLKEFEN